MEREPFTVDLNDPEDIRLKHEEARGILKDWEDRLAELRDIERLVDEWKANVSFLASKLPAEPESDASAQSAPGPGPTIADLVVEVVNREKRKIQSSAVRDILQSEGHEVSTQSVSNAMHYAAHKSKRIKTALGRGMYAPLTFVETPQTDYAEAATHGFPAPEGASGPASETV